MSVFLFRTGTDKFQVHKQLFLANISSNEENLKEKIKQINLPILKFSFFSRGHTLWLLNVAHIVK